MKPVKTPEIVTKIETQTRITRIVDIPREIVMDLFRRNFNIPADANFTISTDVYEAGEVGGVHIEWLEVKTETSEVPILLP